MYVLFCDKWVQSNGCPWYGVIHKRMKYLFKWFLINFIFQVKSQLLLLASLLFVGGSAQKKGVPTIFGRRHSSRNLSSRNLSSRNSQSSRLPWRNGKSLLGTFPFNQQQQDSHHHQAHHHDHHDHHDHHNHHQVRYIMIIMITMIIIKSDISWSSWSPWSP